MSSNHLPAGQSRCRACREVIVFLTSKKTGKFVPVDAETCTDDELEQLRLKNIHNNPDIKIYFDHTRHTAHFATCPEADQFRKKG